jgi:hypothetical protein
VGIQKIDNKMCQFLHQLAGTENKNLKNAGSWELLKTKILSKGILWYPPPRTIFSCVTLFPLHRGHLSISLMSSPATMIDAFQNGNRAKNEERGRNLFQLIT